MVDTYSGSGAAKETAHSVKLEGEYDLARREELATLFSSVSAHGPATVDMSGVTYVDSSFLHELARLHFRLNGNVITLTGTSAAMRRLLSIVNFDQLFSIEV